MDVSLYSNVNKQNIPDHLNINQCLTIPHIYNLELAKTSFNFFKYEVWNFSNCSSCVKSQERV